MTGAHGPDPESRASGLPRPAVIAALAGGLLLPGCAQLGPASVATDRSVYAQVIDRTESEQLLSVIVRERYDDTYSMVAVAGITANLQFRASAGAQAGIGPDSAYAGNLVPLSGGVAYENNPTISYEPLDGADFVNRMLAPLSLHEAFSIVAASKGLNRGLFDIMVLRINGLNNPRFVTDSVGGDRFRHVGDLWSRLLDVRCVQLGLTAEDAPIVVFNIDTVESRDVCREMFELLEINRSVELGDRLSVQVKEGTRNPTDDQNISCVLGSALDLIRAAGQSVDVPDEHIAANIAEAHPNHEPSPLIRIRSSKNRPSDAAVSVVYRDWWYYISDSDPSSKRAFSLLRLLMGLRLHEPNAPRNRPMLTIPVR